MTVLYRLILIFFVSFTFFSSQAVDAASNEKELFVVAQRAFEDGFFDVSLRYVDQLLEQFPESSKKVEASLLKGQCYFFKKQYLMAFNVFKNLTEEGTYKDITLFWLGETHLKVGDHENARKQYEELVKIYPQSLYAPQAYYSLAWSYFEKSDYPKAKEIFLTLIKKFPTHSLVEDALFKAAEADYNAGQYEGAVFLFKQYDKEHKNSVRQFEAIFNIAEAYYYLQQYSHAGEYYKKALDLVKNPQKKLTSFIGLGWAEFKQDKFDQAIQTFQQAKEYADASKLSQEEILLGLASLYSAQDKHAHAVEIYTNLIENFPGSKRFADAILGRANMYYQIKSYPQAIEDYKRIVDVFGKEDAAVQMVEKARFGLAWTYLKDGKLVKSIESFKSVLEMTTSKSVKVSALMQIGDAYQEVGQMDQAIEAYDQILKEMGSTPYSDYAQFRLGVALLKSGRFDPAILALQALQANYPKSRFVSDSYYYLGLAYFKKNDWIATVDVLKPFVDKSLKKAEFVPQAHQLIGLSLLAQKKFTEALSSFYYLAKQYFDDEEVARDAELGIAKTHYEMGKDTEALASFKEITFRYPKTDVALEALMWMGKHAMSSEIYERALSHYEQALKDFSDHPKRALIHFEMGRAFHAMGALDKALAQYRMVTSLGTHPELVAKAKLAIADIFAREIDPAKAIETYQTIAETSPEYQRDAYMKIARIHRKNKNFDEERKAYEKALLSTKRVGSVSVAQIYFLIADACEVAGKTNEAVEEYFKVPYLYPKETPWVIKSYLRVGKIYENQEKWDEAIAVYEKVVDLKVDEAKFAEERLRWIEENR